MAAVAMTAASVMTPVAVMTAAAVVMAAAAVVTAAPAGWQGSAQLGGDVWDAWPAACDGGGGARFGPRRHVTAETAALGHPPPGRAPQWCTEKGRIVQLHREDQETVMVACSTE